MKNRPKTVYAIQEISIARGDRLRWTRNNRAAKIRNGQRFTITEIDNGGNAQIVDDRGQTSQINLGGYQYIDYALVNTTYSSQGKTADRVLALMDGTTSQESFYVAASRAKRYLSIYTTDIAELTQKVQRLRAKENASEYIPLFQVVNSHAQTQKENKATHCSVFHNRRDIGECTGSRIAEKLRTALWRDSSTQPSEHQPTTANSPGYNSTNKHARLIEQLERAGSDLTHSANEIESNASRIIYKLQQQRHWRQFDLFKRMLGEIREGISHLEQQLRQRQQLSTRISRTLDQLKSVTRTNSASRRWHYQSLWEHYSQDIQVSNLTSLDRAIVAKALSDGQSRKEVGLMLVAGSSNVKRIGHSAGKRKAMLYIHKTVSSFGQNKSRRSSIRQTKQLEM